MRQLHQTQTQHVFQWGCFQLRWDACSECTVVVQYETHTNVGFLALVMAGSLMWMVKWVVGWLAIGEAALSFGWRMSPFWLLKGRSGEAPIQYRSRSSSSSIAQKWKTGCCAGSA
jgi:hypothetical protein